MKYMGSKRNMLTNGLGQILNDNICNYDRFVDLFAGSTAVACHVAENYDVEVLSNDLQSYSAALAEGILTRTVPSQADWVETWIAKIENALRKNYLFRDVTEIQSLLNMEKLGKTVLAARNFCEASEFSMVSAYGGYYLSPLQALILDICRSNLPKNPDHKSIAFSAIIQVASICCASPGHTAQPFKPNDTAGPYILEAWSKDALAYIRSRCLSISLRHAKKKGSAIVLDANSVTPNLKQSDLVFVDPPYSGVHYSRFYHVLETLARGKKTDVSGSGRYPPYTERPTSNYSMRTTSHEAMQQLLIGLEFAECGAILTYPAGSTSNGLSGEDVLDLISDSFEINYANVKGRFSTLGGNKKNRKARVASKEMLLFLQPKRKSVLLIA